MARQSHVDSVMRYTNDSPASECALLTVKVMLEGGEHETQASAVLNEWAATPEWVLKPVTARSRWVVTHVPSGLRTGVAMTRIQAERTVAALRAVTLPIPVTDVDSATKLALWMAHPESARALATTLATPSVRGLIPLDCARALCERGSIGISQPPHSEATT